MAQVRDILIDVKKIDAIESNVTQLQTDITNFDALPSQTGQDGKFLTTNSGVASWATVTQPTLVSQLSNDAGYQTASQVSASIAGLVDSAPSTLNTLNELAAALGDDPNFATSITTQIGSKWTQDNTKISNWDSAYSWGNHANGGYLNYTTLSDGTGHGFKVGPHLSYYSFQTEGTNSGIYFNNSFGFLKANYVPILQWDASKVTIKNSSYTDTITLNGSNGNLTAVAFIGNGSQLTNLPQPDLSSYATQTYVNTQVSNLVNAAPATLDTLKELATALGNDANFSTTITTSIGTKWTQDNAKISNWDSAYSWGNHANAGYALTSTVNTALALKADQSTTYTKTEVNNALALKTDLSTYNSFVSSTNSSISTINTGLAHVNFPGCSPLYAANSAVEIFDAGIRGKGFFWLNSPNGGKVLNFCDLDTLDQDGKAGWILVAMFPMAQNWRDDGLSTRMTLNPYDIMMNQNDGTPQADRKLWSANWGDYQMNRFRIQNAWSVNEAGSNATMDWYFNYTNACAWKQVWNFQAGTGNYINDTTGDNNGNINAAYCSGYPAPTNQAGSIPRCCLRGFKSAYNLRYGYSVDQRWNNLSDSGGGGTAQNTTYNWWAGLTQPHYTLGWGVGGDGSLAILPQGSSYTAAGQDCDSNNFKVGVDDTGGATLWASSATASAGQTGLTDTYRSLFFWIK